MRQDFVNQPAQIFAVILFFKGPLKPLLWAKGLNLGTVIDEVTMSADGKLIVVFTQDGEIIAFDNGGGSIKSAVKNPDTIPYISREVKTVLISSING